MKKAVIFGIFLFGSILQAQQTGTDDYNRFLLAQSYEQQNDFPKAQKIYEELYHKDALNINYFNSLNRVYLQQKNFAASILITEERIKKYPDDVNLIGQLGSAYYMQGNFEKAYQVWDEPLRNPNATHVTYRVLANYAIERRAFEKAIEILEKAKPKTNDRFMISMDIANLYSLTMRYEKAAEEYFSVLESSPSQLSVVQNRVLAYISKPDALTQTINVFEKRRKSDNSALLSLTARLYTEQKNFDKAFSIYSELDSKQQSQGGELYNYAGFVFSEGEYEIASDVYKTIIERYPDSKIVSSAKLGYAKAQEAILKQKFLSSIENWKSFSPLPKLDNKQVDPALRAFEEITKIYKQSELAIESYLRMAQIKFRLQGDLESAEELLLRVIKDYPISVLTTDAYLDLAEINLIQGNLEKSSEYYENVSKSRSIPIDKKNEAHFHLAKIKAYQGEFDSARLNLSEIMKNFKDNLANDALEFSLVLNTAKNDSSNLLVYSEAELLAERMLFEEAKLKYDQLIINKQAFVFHSIAKLRSAQMDIAIQNYDKAVKSLTEIYEEKEKNIYSDKALYLLGNIFEFALTDVTKAIDSYEKLLLDYPGSIYIDKARNRIQFLRSKTS